MKPLNNPILRSFKEVFYVSKSMFIWNYGLTLAQGITNALPIIALQRFFDAIISIFDGGGNWRRALWSLFLFLGLKILSHIIQGITDYNYEYYDLKVAHNMMDKTNRKVGLFRPLIFEEAQTLDTIQKAYQGTGEVRSVVDTIMLVALYHFPELAVIVVYLYHANPWLPIVVLLIVFAVIVPEHLRERYYSDAEELTANVSRRIEAYDDYISGLRHCGETKLLNLHPLFLDKSKNCISERNNILWGCFCKMNRLEVAEKLITLTGHLLILILLFLCATNGSISIGVFAAVFTSLDSLFEMIASMVGQLSGGISEVLGKVKNYLKVQDTPMNLQEPRHDEALTSISLEHASFTYPNSSEPAINDITFSIRSGEHIAVVGENGSGKTTLVRLLSGLYPPTLGAVKYNGQTGKNMQRAMSAVFQNFGRYHLSVAENIIISDTSSNTDPAKALDKASFNPNSDDNIASDTILGREFGGVELSGGQWQHLAIARGFYRRSHWIFLDEPTSAIDPIEEGRMLRQLHDLAAGKTTVTVTHRLGSIQYADKVIVMKRGCIVGFDTHKALLENCAEYQKIWNAQSEMLV